MIGFGLSDKPADLAYHTLVRHIENLGSVVNLLGLRDITVVAHGWGGPIALGYAMLHPENISRMVLCNTWVLPVPEAARVRQPWSLRLAESGRVGRYLDSVLNLSLPASILSRTYQRPSDWTLEAYNYPFPNFESRTAIRAFTKMFFDPEHPANATLARIHDGLKNITAPVDILQGAADPVLSKLPAYVLRDALRNAREPRFIENASHFLPEDAPEVLADTVLHEQSSSATQSESVFKILS
jgi:haloalkane dehalogenase